MAVPEQEYNQQPAVQPERTNLEGTQAAAQGANPAAATPEGGGRKPKSVAQRKQFVGPGGVTYVRDGSVAFPLEDVLAVNGDFNALDPSTAISYQGWMNKQVHGGAGGGMKAFRQNLHGEYGRDEGNRVFQERLRMSKEAEAAGASPELQDYLFFQEAVLLPGGVVASYAGGNGDLVFEDLQGNPVQGTPEMQQLALAEHQRIYGAAKYGGGGPNPNPSLPAPPTATTATNRPQAPGPIYSNRPAPPPTTRPPVAAPAPAVDTAPALPKPPSPTPGPTSPPQMDYGKAFATPAGGGSDLTGSLPGMPKAPKAPKLGGLLDMNFKV